MNASRIHAVIAAGLDNPQLLARWRREPELLRDCGVDPREFDLEALWKFAGLTAKVRHNGLRAELPLTFRLMNVAELEIEVFASYASFHASEGGQRYANNVESRTQYLLAFLERWLDFERREHALVWDMIRYELALTRLSKLAVDIPSPVDESPAQPVARAASVPSLRGEVILSDNKSNIELYEYNRNLYGVKLRYDF